MNHYYAKNFFSPVLASIYQTDRRTGDIVIEIMSDDILEYSGTLNVKLFRVDSTTSLMDATMDVTAV